MQALLNEEFPGIKHIHTSTLHKKVTNARHDFLRLPGTENKLEALIQASFLWYFVMLHLWQPWSSMMNSVALATVSFANCVIGALVLERCEPYVKEMWIWL